MLSNNPISDYTQKQQINQTPWILSHPQILIIYFRHKFDSWYLLQVAPAWSGRI